jgi:hypothetical protein
MSLKADQKGPANTIPGAQHAPRKISNRSNASNQQGLMQ